MERVKLGKECFPEKDQRDESMGRPLHRRRPGQRELRRLSTLQDVILLQLLLLLLLLLVLVFVGRMRGPGVVNQTIRNAIPRSSDAYACPLFVYRKNEDSSSYRESSIGEEVSC
jgi:hypothetical protein